ncbi:hypothetical protein Bbelb_295430 [Branchiostoma belcheri]|nr:hypothetical protein Bbelb_295430 [Branchiostoma belcheri]
MSRVPCRVSPVITQKSHIGNNARYISSWRDLPCSTETEAPEGEGSVAFWPLTLNQTTHMADLYTHISDPRKRGRDRTSLGDKQTWKSRPCHLAGEFWPGSQSLNSQPVVAPDPALINYGVADCQSGLCYRGLGVTITKPEVGPTDTDVTGDFKDLTFVSGIQSQGWSTARVPLALAPITEHTPKFLP